MTTTVELRAVLPLPATLESIRFATADLAVLIVGDDLPAVERTMLIACIGPLAIELAPARRLCALDVGAGADPADVAAATRYLTEASSTTGQVLRIG